MGSKLIQMSASAEKTGLEGDDDVAVKSGKLEDSGRHKQMSMLKNKNLNR